MTLQKQLFDNPPDGLTLESHDETISLQGALSLPQLQKIEPRPGANLLTPWLILSSLWALIVLLASISLVFLIFYTNQPLILHRRPLPTPISLILITLFTLICLWPANRLYQRRHRLKPILANQQPAVAWLLTLTPSQWTTTRQVLGIPYHEHLDPRQITSIEIDQSEIIVELPSHWLVLAGPMSLPQAQWLAAALTKLQSQNST